jgi:hypothetical protein
MLSQPAAATFDLAPARLPDLDPSLSGLLLGLLPLLPLIPSGCGPP